MEKGIEWVMGVLMVLVVAALVGYGLEAPEAEVVAAQKVGEARSSRTVVIDPGHGGQDPGKVGVNGVLEKDINLAIAKELQQFLEAADVEVILTRETEAGLYRESDRNKKAADLRARCRLIEDAKPALVVSIHQNSYPEAEVKGPQVFYYTGSEEGRKLAEQVQESFDGLLGAENTRKPKANGDYYLLKQVAEPIVIVECGFLSNPKEAADLADATYRQRVAWSIHLGILRYLNGREAAEPGTENAGGISKVLPNVERGNI